MFLENQDLGLITENAGVYVVFRKLLLKQLVPICEQFQKNYTHPFRGDCHQISGLKPTNNFAACHAGRGNTSVVNDGVAERIKITPKIVARVEAKALLHNLRVLFLRIRLIPLSQVGQYVV